MSTTFPQAPGATPGLHKTKAQARQEALRIVENWSSITLLTGWIPGSGLISGGADQLMIRQIADAYGVAVFSMDAVLAHLVGLVAASAGGSLAAELFNFVPVVGWAAKSLTLASKVHILGNGTITYFEKESQLPD